MKLGVVLILAHQSNSQHRALSSSRHILFSFLRLHVIIVSNISSIQEEEIIIAGSQNSNPQIMCRDLFR